RPQVREVGRIELRAQEGEGLVAVPLARAERIAGAERGPLVESPGELGGRAVLDELAHLSVVAALPGLERILEPRAARAADAEIGGDLGRLTQVVVAHGADGIAPQRVV